MSRRSMDNRLRDLERDALSGCEVARARLARERKRSAAYRAGDFVRLDASRAAGWPNLVGNFVILTARTEPEVRTYTVARLGASLEAHARDATTLDESSLMALIVAPDAPLVGLDGQPIPPCPAPLHQRVSVRTRSLPLDRKVIAKPRVRRTRAPEIALAIPSANLDLGIFVRPRARHAAHVIQPEPAPEPVEAEEYGEEWDGVEAEVDVVEDIDDED